MTGGVLFHVQHLLGIGHLQRSLRIAEALVDAGIAVTLVHGGTPVPEGAGDPVDHERTLATAGGAADAVARLVAGFLEEWGHDRVGRESVGAG